MVDTTNGLMDPQWEAHRGLFGKQSELELLIAEDSEAVEAGFAGVQLLDGKSRVPIVVEFRKTSQ
ncbi:hypothetical protein T265_10208 [Opisthorchis viverrini]|uniref:Uncharacterized protein n=1 Tax=Opisthorchis viverrini TaxID=6198 RepID=A0A075A244_OPIVI|nr:hypothetical protein T265_10208 [Opisthorchis viverrini]KER21474.1 hypothetical protein T265_10208 [Opisthorchis viverrini]